MLQSPSNSILVNVDSYKPSMGPQYPEDTEVVFSHGLSRGGIYPSTVFFGLQAFVKEVLMRRVTKADVDFAEAFWKLHGEPFDRTMWDLIVDKYHGKLPVRLMAVPEGQVIPTGNVLFTLENTGGKATRLLTTWLETPILRAVWYGTTVATVSWSIKQVIRGYLEKSGDPANLPFKLHDFGARGVSSMESARIGGAAHLVNFMGTDNVQGIMFLHDHYNADLFNTGFSIPAAEHSTITSWGRENEFAAYENMDKQFGGKNKMYAVVSDSYNIYNVIQFWKTKKEKLAADGATVVIRPDSGDPCIVLPKLIYQFDVEFGHTMVKGYKLLNNIRFLWGDGINQQTIESILRLMVDTYGWSADNFAFGMGGALLQHMNRDDLKFAMKCSSILINGVWRDVYKDPITDPGKKSLAGRVTLYRDPDGKYHSGVEDWPTSVLQLVYEDGELYRDMNLGSVRANSEL